MKKRILSLVLSVCVAVTFSLVAQTSVASAEDYVDSINFAKKITVVHYPGGTQTTKHLNKHHLDMGSRIDWEKPMSVKIQKKSVLKKYSEDGFATKKSGKSKLTITGYKNGKRVKYTCTVKVVKYKNPFKKFKIGKKNYAKKFKRPKYFDAFTDIKSPKGKKKLSIKCKKGWKVRNIEYSYWDAKTESHVTKKVKNKKKISFKTGARYEYPALSFQAYNKKKKVKIDYYVPLY